MFTLRKPVTPSNGASTRMRTSWAWARATWAKATSSAAAFWSTALWLTKFCASRSRLRCRLVRAMLACASAWRNWACCRVSSSCTSNCPRCTRWPSAKPSLTMRPLTSGRIITPWLERSDPTAVVSFSRRMRVTLPASTTTGPAWPAGPPGPLTPLGPLGPLALRLPATAKAVAGGTAPASPPVAGARFCTHQAPASAKPRPSSANVTCSFFITASKSSPRTVSGRSRPRCPGDYLCGPAWPALSAAPAGCRRRGWPAHRHVRCPGHRCGRAPSAIARCAAPPGRRASATARCS